MENGYFFDEAIFVQNLTESNLRAGMAANEVNYLKSTTCSETIENGIPDHQVPSKRQREIFSCSCGRGALKRTTQSNFSRKKADVSQSKLLPVYNR